MGDTMKKKVILLGGIFLFLTIIIFFGVSIWKQEIKGNQRLQNQREITNRIEEIKKKNQEYVQTTQEAKLYQLIDGTYQVKGTVAQNVSLQLNPLEEVTEDSGYLPLKHMDYFIFYQDIEPMENLEVPLSNIDRYVVFNENVVTSEKTIFYQNDQIVYELDQPVDLPIVMKDDVYWYVTFDHKLLGIKKDESSTRQQHNTNEEIASSIAVLNYHFFYDVENQSECNQTICLSVDQFRTHLDYLKEQQFLTLRMEDLERFIDGKIQLPKRSVVITIDDGWFCEKGLALLNEYQMNATLFLMTMSYDPNNYRSNYIEVHSHGDNLHYPGACPGGQGGPIKCYPHDLILEDLKTSREKLNGSTIFCYPFYEYNDYAIGLLQEAGFTMAFIGGNQKVKVGANKMILPRYPVVSSMSLNDIVDIIS